MKNKHRLTFLMAAHNEEKVIGAAIKSIILLHKDYKNIELIIGLDGCTDNTLKIVKKFMKDHKFIKYNVLNERGGKQRVLDRIEHLVTGDIVFIQDADSSIIYKSKKDLLDFIKVFDKKFVGGIANSIDSEMSRKDFNKIKSYGFISSAWGNHFLVKYLIEKFTFKKSGILVYKKDLQFYPFIDFYNRKVLSKTKHNPNLRAGDHVERSLRIINAGYEIVAYQNPNWPHLEVNYNDQSLKDLLKQKIRGLIAKKKLSSEYNFKTSFFGFHIPFLIYVLKNSFKVKRIRDFNAIYIYLGIMFYASMIAFFKKNYSTKEIWALRIKR